VLGIKGRSPEEKENMGSKSNKVNRGVVLGGRGSSLRMKKSSLGNSPGS